VVQWVYVADTPGNITRNIQMDKNELIEAIYAELDHIIDAAECLDGFYSESREFILDRSTTIALLLQSLAHAD